MDWNGTRLDFEIEHVKTVNKINYGYLKGTDQECIYVKRKNLLPVIIDEIKPLFDLHKLGCRYNDKYIIYRPYILYEEWWEEELLKKYSTPLTYTNRRELRNILLFRYILELKQINENSIIVRDKHLYSYFEHTGFSEKELSMRIINDHFSENDLSESLNIMLKRGTANRNDGHLFFQLRKEITKIVRRVDKNHIYLVDHILEHTENLYKN
jgi:hypothetical protein